MTTIFNKQRLIDWINRNVKETDIVLMTMDMTGSVSVNKKNNEKKVGFAFAADAFEAKDDVRDLAFRLTPSLALVIANPKYISEDSKQMLEEGLKNETPTP